LTLNSIIWIQASNIESLGGLHLCVVPKLCKVWPQEVINQPTTR